MINVEAGDSTRIKHIKSTIRLIDSWAHSTTLRLEFIPGREARLILWQRVGQDMRQDPPQEGREVPIGIVSLRKMGTMPGLEPGRIWYGYSAPIDLLADLFARAEREVEGFGPGSMTTTHPERRVYVYQSKRAAVGTCDDCGRPLFRGRDPEEPVSCRYCPPGTAIIPARTEPLRVDRESLEFLAANPGYAVGQHGA